MPVSAWIQARSNRLAPSNREANAATIAYGGPVFALAFLVPWFPWGRSGGPFVILHFMVRPRRCPACVCVRLRSTVRSPAGHDATGVNVAMGCHVHLRRAGTGGIVC